jgi:hypothetical protein
MTDKVPVQQEIKVSFPDNLKGGVYSNLMFVSHSKEEFILDFMMVSPPQGTVTARVIMSPGHMKRTIVALQENLKKYETSYGKLEEAPEPTKGKGKLGFATQ